MLQHGCIAPLLFLRSCHMRYAGWGPCLLACCVLQYHWAMECWSCTELYKVACTLEHER